MLIIIIQFQEYLNVMDDPFVTLLPYIPVTMDLRELGLVTTPKNIGFAACGSAAAAVASIAESSILLGW